MIKNTCLLFLLLLSLLSRSQVPEYKVDIHDTSACQGYYFLSVSNQRLNTMMILDKTGGGVCYKSLPIRSSHVYNFALQPNGMMSYSNLRKFYLIDSSFKVVDSVAYHNKYQTDTHDLLVLPNGHLLFMGADTVKMDLSNSPFWNRNYDSSGAWVRWAVIQEMDAQRNVVFEWHAKDHFAFDDADTFFLAASNIVEATHANAIEVDHDGNILLSSRNFSEVTKINRKDGSIIWRLGGKRNQFKFINCPIPFYGQHDIRRVSNGDITLFDNGNHTIPHGARALEFALDETNKTATLKWSYAYDSVMFSNARGNVQRLGNSNTLISFGVLVNNNVSFVVVDPTGSKVLQLSFKDSSSSYRVLNHLSLPWKLNRPQITCFDSSGITYLDAGTGYDSYKWNNDSTTRIIPVNAKDAYYYVFVPYGEGAYIRSEIFVVNNEVRPCATRCHIPWKKKKPHKRISKSPQ